MHNITPSQHHAIINIKVAISAEHSNCEASIADGLNETLRPAIDCGFLADYAFYNSESPELRMASSKPEEGELFTGPNEDKANFLNDFLDYLEGQMDDRITEGEVLSEIVSSDSLDAIAETFLAQHK